VKGSILRIALVLTIWTESTAHAQGQPGKPAPQAVEAGLKEFVHTVGDLWTSPLHIHHRDWRWLVPLAAGTGVLLAVDPQISQNVTRHEELMGPSRSISQWGNVYSFAIPLTLFGIGHVTGHASARRAGGAGMQAYFQSALTLEALKIATNRQRPSNVQGDGGFWDGGKSFPSGHAMTSWALASVLTTRYPHRHWLAIAAYSGASAVSLSRISGKNHFPSDVLIGSSLGWLIGRRAGRHP